MDGIQKLQITKRINREKQKNRKIGSLIVKR